MKLRVIIGQFSILLLLLQPLAAQDSTLAMNSIINLDSTGSGEDTDQPMAGMLQAIVIKSGENDTSRWVSVAVDRAHLIQGIHYPTIETDANAGSFDIELYNLDSNAYLGSDLIQDSGKFPIQYKVEFPDSLTLHIQGQVLPYDDISTSYSFDKDEYRIEFIFKNQSQKLFKQAQEMPQEQKVVSAHAEPSPEYDTQLNHNLIDKKTSEFKAMLKRSVMLATIALGATLFLFFLIVFVKKQLRHKSTLDQNFSEVLDEKVDAPESDDNGGEPGPTIMTPELKEERIRNLMENDKLSYDEAALRVQYEQMDQDD